MDVKAFLIKDHLFLSIFTEIVVYVSMNCYYNYHGLLHTILLCILLCLRFSSPFRMTGHGRDDSD